MKATPKSKNSTLELVHSDRPKRRRQTLESMTCPECGIAPSAIEVLVGPKKTEHGRFYRRGSKRILICAHCQSQGRQNELK